MQVVAHRVGKGNVPPWSTEIVKTVIKKINTKSAPEVAQWIRFRMANWKTKIPVKIQKTKKRRDELFSYVRPTGRNVKIWRWVSITGTKPHVIKPRRAKALVFPWGGPGSYRPKTAPVGKFGGPGTVTNPQMAFAKQVQHPGFKPRLFEPTIAKEHLPRFASQIHEAIEEGLAIARRKAKTG